jgi:hypothetical protein
MSYIRSKIINGCGPYYYEVKSVRHGKKVSQVYIRYVGKDYPGNPDQYPEENVVPKEEPKKAYLEIEGSEERKELKTWTSQRRRQAERIAKATDSTMFQADGLAKSAWRLGRDPATVDWDSIQGRDLSYEEKQRKLAGMGEETMSKRSLLREEDYEAEAEEWESQQQERAAYRSREFAGADI